MNPQEDRRQQLLAAIPSFRAILDCMEADLSREDWNEVLASAYQYRLLDDGQVELGAELRDADGNALPQPFHFLLAFHRGGLFSRYHPTPPKDAEELLARLKKDPLCVNARILDADQVIAQWEGGAVSSFTYQHGTWYVVQ